MRKTVVLTSPRPEGWESCIEIQRDLRQCYQNALGENCLILDYHHPFRKKRNPSSLEKIKRVLLESIEFGATDFVFLDHDVNPNPFLVMLEFLWQKNCRVFVHLYGNWQMQMTVLDKYKDSFMGKPIHFIAPSTYCSKELQKFSGVRSRSIKVVPFPVKTEMFTFNESHRKKIRKELGVPEEGKLLVFAGRIGEKKGAHFFFQLCRSLKTDDRVHAVTFGRVYKGEDDWWAPKFLAMQKNFGKRFTHRGHVPREELAEYFSAADIFISASLYRYEIFGLAPIEALSAGLRCILTDWMGYQDLKGKSSRIAWLNVRKERRLPRLSVGGAKVKCLELLGKQHSSTDRALRAREMQRMYSLEACANRLRILFKEKEKKR